MTTLGKRLAAAFAAFTLLVLMGVAQVQVHAQGHAQGKPDSQNSLAGAWRVNILGFGPTPVPILMTFARDGTLLQTDTPVLLPQPVPPQSAASNGHGLWRKSGGREYAFTYVKIFYGAEGPALATVAQRAQLSLADDGNSFTARTVGTDFVGADGTPISPGTVAALTFTGTRITLTEGP